MVARSSPPILRHLVLGLLLAASALTLFASEAGAQPQVEPPLGCAPTGFTATAMGMVVKLEWNVTPLATEYHIYKAREDGGFRLRILEEGTSNSTIDTQVESNTTYRYYIVAVVAGSETRSCGVVEVVASPDACNPWLTVEVESGVNRLTWTFLPVAESYQLYRAEGDGPFRLLNAIHADYNNYSDHTVEFDTTYSYEVRYATDNVVRGACNTVTVTTPPPPCAPMLSVRARDGPRNDLTWTNLTTAAGYNVYRAEAGGNFTLISSLPVGALGYSDTRVEAGAAYRYQVRAVADGKIQEPCNTVEATAVPIFPSLVAAALAIAASTLGYVLLRRK